jgi:hypothetical protein
VSAYARKMDEIVSLHFHPDVLLLLFTQYNVQEAMAP